SRTPPTKAASERRSTVDASCGARPRPGCGTESLVNGCDPRRATLRDRFPERGRPARRTAKPESFGKEYGRSSEADNTKYGATRNLRPRAQSVSGPARP